MRISAVVLGASLVLAAGGARAEKEKSRGEEPALRGAPVRVTNPTPAPAGERVNRGDRSGSRSRVHVGVGGYYGHGYRGYRGYRPGGYPYIGYRGYYGGWGPGWSVWWDPYWYGPAWGYAGGYTNAYPRAGFRHGALDIDIAPERAEVWVDGERIGVADDFDGFPDYLWLEQGTYDVVFYSEGRQTLARQYTIYPGLVIDVEDRLAEGDAVHPLDLGPKTHERRDERIRRDRETRENAERIRDGSELRRQRPLDRPAGVDEESLDARGEPGRIALTVSPDDASVYLDGRFLGSAGELGRLRAGLLVDPGDHRVEIVRPGYRAVELAVTVEEGEEERVDVALEPEPGERVD